MYRSTHIDPLGHHRHVCCAAACMGTPHLCCASELSARACHRTCTPPFRTLLLQKVFTNNTLCARARVLKTMPLLLQRSCRPKRSSHAKGLLKTAPRSAVPGWHNSHKGTYTWFIFIGLALWGLVQKSSTLRLSKAKRSSSLSSFGPCHAWAWDAIISLNILAGFVRGAAFDMAKRCVSNKLMVQNY